MIAAIPFPDLSPEIFSIEVFGITFALRWYALAYVVGILLGWRLALAAVRRPHLWAGERSPVSPRDLEDWLTWVIIGIIAGGRLGFVLFYQPGYYLANPGQILAVWNGGMSFHGGFLGVVLVTLLFAWRRGIPLGSLSDLAALGTPPGLLLGRLANFVNGELWGRPSDVPWAVAFPGAAAQDCPGIAGLCARHPSQLYEAALEGLLLGGVLVWLAWRRGALTVPWRLTAVFFTGYGLARFVVEFFRQADAQFVAPGNPLGHVLRLGEFGLTMGQLLSLPMLLVGVALLIWSSRRA